MGRVLMRTFRHSRTSLLVFFAVVLAVPAASQNLQVFFGNLHSHTSYSDGQGKPRDAYRHARDVADLDFLAITEHNHSQAGPLAGNHALYNGMGAQSLMSAAAAFNRDGRFVAIFGQEFSTISSGNHANVFEVRDVIDQGVVPNGAWDVLLSTWIPNHLDESGQPALILLNHPSINNSPNEHEYGIDDFATFEEWRAALDARAELINIINGPSHDSSAPGSPSEAEYRRYLNMGLHVGPTADQDNHRRNWGSAAQTRTAVLAETLTKPVIMAALRARRVYASEDRNLRIIPRIGGHLIGTQVPAGGLPQVGAELPVVVEIHDDDEPSASYLVEVLSDQIGGNEDANVVQSARRDGNGTITVNSVLYEGGDQYVFLRITQEHDEDESGDRVWTAPVWFEADADAESVPPPDERTAALVLIVDLVRETARIENRGAAQMQLGGWTLVSRQGEQSFVFAAGTVVGPGGALTVVSGARANSPLLPGELAWLPAQNIWRNSGDPGELRNASGEVMATAP